MTNWELPLVFLTVLTQWAVGIALMMTIVEFVFPQAITDENAAKFRIGGMATFPLIAVAVLSSILHLGQPLAAMNAFRHLGTAMLSMETLCSVVMIVLSLLYAFIWWKKSDRAALRKYTGLLLAVVGIVSVVISSRVYMLPARMAWNSWTTTASFLITAVLLGAFSVLLMLAGTGNDLGKGGTLFSSVSVLVILCAVAVTICSFISGSAEQTNAILATVSSPLFYVRALLGIVVPAFCAGMVLRSEKNKVNLAALGLLCALLGELSGRILFYASTLNQAPWF